jgi:hypothetical protein
MSHKAAVAALVELTETSLGTFRGREAVAAGVARKQMTALCTAGVVERMHPDVYRLAGAPASNERALRAALPRDSVFAPRAEFVRVVVHGLLPSEPSRGGRAMEHDDEVTF